MPERHGNFEALRIKRILELSSGIARRHSKAGATELWVIERESRHPSLHFKAVSGNRYRSVRVGLHYRALGVPVPDGVQWFWIGSHADYDKLLG